MKFGLEAKVGIFVIVVFVILGYMTTKVGDFSFGQPSGYQLVFKVPDASGLTKDSVVKFKGVDVGIVEDVKLQDGFVNVVLRIKDEYKIPNNVALAVRSSGFLGEKYAELKTTEAESTRFVKEGETLENFEAGSDIDQLTSKFSRIADDIKAITSSLKEVLASTEGRDNMKSTLENVRYTTEIMRELMKSNQERINNIVKNVENLTATLENITVSNQENINELIANLKSFSAELNSQTPIIAEKINRIANNMESITGDVDDVVKGSKTDLRETISSMRTVTAKLEKTVDNINEITDKINKGDGTIATLINDNKTAEDVKETIKGLKKMVDQYDKFQLNLEFAGEQMVDTGESKGYFKVKIDPRDNQKYYLLGIASTQEGTTSTTVSSYRYDNPPDNIGHDYTETKTEREEDSITFIAQYAHQMFYDDLFLRLGIMESEFGLGFDYTFIDDKFEASFDAYDFSDESDDRDPHLKAKLRYKFGDYFFVDGGYDDFMNTDTRSFFFGGGLSFTDNDIKSLLSSVPMPSQ